MKDKKIDALSANPIVHVVDDDEAVLDSVTLLLSSIGIPHISYISAEAFLKAYATKDFNRHYGCILLDIRMPHLSGIECHHRLDEIGCQLPIIFVTGHADVPIAVASMKHGAFDFIQKPYREQVLIESIQKAILLNKTQQEHIAQMNITKAKLATLTARETQVLNLVIVGKANKVIADELSLSQRTVEIHRANLMEKMGTKSLVELVKIVMDI